MILASRYIVPKGYIAITLYPFVFVRYKALKKDKRLINHERIHLQQQLELLILPFYVLYVLEFFVRLLYYKSWHLAYTNISFEREAFVNDSNFNYLKNRRFWQFLKYMIYV